MQQVVSRKSIKDVAMNIVDEKGVVLSQDRPPTVARVDAPSEKYVENHGMRK